MTSNKANPNNPEGQDSWESIAENLFGIDLGKLPDAGQIDLPDEPAAPVKREPVPVPSSQASGKSAPPPPPKSPSRGRDDEPFGTGLSDDFESDAPDRVETSHARQPDEQDADRSADLDDDSDVVPDDLVDADAAEPSPDAKDDTYWDALNDWEWGEGDASAAERTGDRPPREGQRGDRGRRGDRDRGKRGDRQQRGNREQGRDRGDRGRGGQHDRDRDRDRGERERRDERSERPRAASSPPPSRPADEAAPRSTHRSEIDDDSADFGAGVLEDQPSSHGEQSYDRESPPERYTPPERAESGEGRGVDAERPRGEGEEPRRRRRRRGRRRRGSPSEREPMRDEATIEGDTTSEDLEPETAAVESDEMLETEPRESRGDDEGREQRHDESREGHDDGGREGRHRRRGRGRGGRDRYPREEGREEVREEPAGLGEPVLDQVPADAEDDDALDADADAEEDGDDSEQLTVPNYSNIPTWADAISYLLHTRRPEGQPAPSARPASDQETRPSRNSGTDADKSRRPPRRRRRRG